MAVLRKKQDDKNLKMLREIVSLGGNKQCFDCNQKGPTYVNMTIGSFVCTRCSGILRGLAPPHRVKSISMATFNTDELEFIKANGNDNCCKTWLGLWDPKRVHTQEHRELMIDKYERKRYYLEPASPLKSLTTSTQILPSVQQQQQTNQNNNNKDNGTASGRELVLNSLSTSRIVRNGAIKGNRKSTQFVPDANSSAFVPKSIEDFRYHTNNNNHNSNSSNNINLSNGINRNGGLNNSTSSPATNVNNNNNINNNASAITKNSNNSDFIADFGSANIFNANPTTPATTSSIQFTKCSSDKFMNGVSADQIMMSQSGNATTTTTTKNAAALNNLNDNFADFDHNPIYNAAANQNNNSSQWNIWQQFQWPFLNNVQPENNRWSLPMSLSSTSNSLNSTGTFSSNSSVNSTPLVDRYAALKDLDEQLREIKDKDLFNSSSSSSSSSATTPKQSQIVGGNPFKQQQQQQQKPSNPFQTQLQQQHVNNTNHTNNWTNLTNDFFPSSNNAYTNITINNKRETDAFNHNGASATIENSAQFKSDFSQLSRPFPTASTLNNSNNPFL